jgi:hypothetical protein
MDWERGDLPPGRVMATFKTGGMRDLLEALAEAAAEAKAGDAKSGDAESDQPDAEAWTPVV